MARILTGDEENRLDVHPLLARLQFLKKKAEAEADPTAVPCPRPDCQTLTGEQSKGFALNPLFRRADSMV